MDSIFELSIIYGKSSSLANSPTQIVQLYVQTVKPTSLCSFGKEKRQHQRKTANAAHTFSDFFRPRRFPHHLQLDNGYGTTAHAERLVDHAR